VKPESTIDNKAKSYSIALRAFKPHQALIIGGYEIFKNLSKPEYTYKTITECRGFMITKAKFLKIMSAFRRQTDHETGVKTLSVSSSFEIKTIMIYHNLVKRNMELAKFLTCQKPHFK
jgi:hypothetical protein